MAEYRIQVQRQADGQTADLIFTVPPGGDPNGDGSVSFEGSESVILDIRGVLDLAKDWGLYQPIQTPAEPRFWSYVGVAVGSMAFGQQSGHLVSFLKIPRFPKRERITGTVY